MARSLKQQTMILTLGNGLTRGLGFALHLIFARLMGAEALGVMEMAHSVGMLALTPVTAGASAAMSRVTARHPAVDQPNVLRAGLRLNLRIAMITMPVLLVCSPLLSWLLGDTRTLPAILAGIPAVALLGQCSVYSGYCCGRQDTLTPALNECTEQTVRFLLSAALLWRLGGQSVALSAALPEAAELAAACLALLMLRRAVRLPRSLARPSPALMKELFRLSAPMAVSRLCLTGMRTLNAVLLPMCLRRSGLSGSTAAAQFGLLNGMAMPLMMLPGIVTGAVCTVATPTVSRLERQPIRLRRVMGQLLLSAAGIGVAASLALGLGAEVISLHLYNQPALTALVRFLCPMALLLSLQQVTGGMIAGLGLQRQSLTGTIVSSAVTLILTALLSPLPGLRLFGAATASLAGQTVALMWNSGILLRRVRVLSAD